MNQRLAHTTTDGKAKCLHYRNGKRCGRKATALVNYKSKATGRPGFMPRCDECAGDDDVTFFTTSAAGYFVKVNVMDPMQQRQYISVEEMDREHGISDSVRGLSYIMAGKPGYAQEVDPRID